MDLVDYEDSVSACCGRHVDLLIEFADIIDGVVGGGVELDHIKRIALFDSAA